MYMASCQGPYDQSQTSKPFRNDGTYIKFTSDSDTALLQLCIITALFMQPKIKIPNMKPKFRLQHDVGIKSACLQKRKNHKN